MWYDRAPKKTVGPRLPRSVQGRFSGLESASRPSGSGVWIFLVARIGFSATTSRESRQGRKAAAAAAMSGAGA